MKQPKLDKKAKQAHKALRKAKKASRGRVWVNAA